MVKSRDPRLTRNYKKQRLVVLARDGYICNYCGTELDDKNATVDHVIPIAKQGNPMDLQNMVSCCKSCNSKKGSRPEHVFLARTATPPVFSQRSLPETVRTVPDSPFIKPDTLDFDAK